MREHSKNMCDDYIKLPYENHIRFSRCSARYRNRVIITYSIDYCIDNLDGFDVCSVLSSVFDDLGYVSEVDYSDDSDSVWFSIATRDQNKLVREVMCKLRTMPFLDGLIIKFNAQKYRCEWPSGSQVCDELENLKPTMRVTPGFFLAA